MIRFLTSIAALLTLSGAQANALHDIVTKGSTNRSVEITIIALADGSRQTTVEHNTAGIDLWYRREGELAEQITEVALAALNTAHTDGGIEHIDDGVYRLDLPDAAFATGAQHVTFGGTVTGMIVIGGRVRLVDYDLETSLPTNFGDMAITPTTGQVTVGTNADKTGYQLTQTFPANFADMSITPTTGRVDVGFVGGTAQTANDNGGDINAIRLVTDQFSFTPAGEVDANAEAWNAVAITSPLETSADFVAAMDANSTQLAAIRQDTETTLPGQISGLNNISPAEVNLQVDTALSDIYLDRLFALDYDAALPPGVPTAFMNELVESDVGVTRLTANALEQAPASGGGTDWTVGEREEIRGRLGVTGTTAVGGNTPTLALQSSINALNDLDAAGVRGAVGLLSPNLDTQLAALPTDADVNAQADQALSDYDPPTRAELTSDISGLNDLDAAGVRAAVGLLSANLDTQLAALPTAAEVRDSIMTATVDGTISVQCSFALMLAYAVGPRSTLGSTHTWRDVADSADRIVGTTIGSSRTLTSLVCP